MWYKMWYNMDEVITLTFSERLQELRNQHGYTRQDLASIWNVSVKTVECYEKGMRKPDIVGLCEIADFYGVSTDYLLGRVDIPNIYVHTFEDSTVYSTRKDLTQQMQNQVSSVDDAVIPTVSYSGSLTELEQLVRRIVVEEIQRHE